LTLRAEQVGRHVIRFCLLAVAPPAEAEGSAGSSRLPSEPRQWVTVEESLAVRPSLSFAAVRPSQSFRKADRLTLACTLESRAVEEAIEITQVQCVAATRGTDAEQVLPLEECAPDGGSQLRLTCGQSAQLLFALRGASPPDLLTGEKGLGSTASSSDKASRRRLLRASREAEWSGPTRDGRAAGSAASVTSPSPSASASSSRAGLTDCVDLVIEWTAEGGRTGEVYALQVPCERPTAAPPCPLDVHILAPDSATLTPGLTVPVTLRVRNASSAGPVSFYFVADPAPELAWLGCERSEVIRLPPMAAQTRELQAYFASPGVFNLNRFRFFVVSIPPGAGAVPASEQAPLAFAFPVERLIHVRESG